MQWSDTEEQGPLLGPERGVNVRLGHKPQEKGMREKVVGGIGGFWFEGTEGKRGGSDEMERTGGIICNSLRALLRHFIQHLVKRDLFCFGFVV